LSEHDYAVLGWFYENITDFNQEFGVVPYLIQELKLSGFDKKLFLQKINLIYQSQLRTGKNKREDNAEY